MTRKPKRLRRPPEATPAETLEVATRAAVSGGLSAGVPILGDAAAAFLGTLFPSVIERRRDAWCADVTKAFNELRQHRVDVDSLRKDERFCDLVMDATYASMRTHIEEKRNALRNIIVNAALPLAPSETKQHMFVELVQQLTEMHLRLLEFLDGPDAWFSSRGKQLPAFSELVTSAINESTSPGMVEALACLAFEDYREQRKFYELLIGDLNRRGLVVPGSFLVEYKQGKRFTSVLGREFLRFIRDPEPPTQDA